MNSDFIVSSARRTLRDDFGQAQAHADADFIDYINRAAKFIVNADSSASVTTGEIPLVSGSVQTLANVDRAVRLLKIFHNNQLSTFSKQRIGARRYSGRHTVKNLELSTLSSQIPDWASTKENAVVVYYAFNSDDPTSFIVWPPNDGNGKVIGTYSALPDDITEISDQAAGTLNLPERFFNTVLNYVMALCLIRDGESTINRQRGQELMATVLAEMGVKSQADASDTPADTIAET